MRSRGYLFSLAFMSFALITTQAAAQLALLDEIKVKSDDRSKTTEASPVLPLPSPLIGTDKILGSAYYDTLNILSTTNKCSEFFGGAGESVDIFNRFIGRVRKSWSPTTMGIRMSGQITNVLNGRTKKEYRLFDSVQINTNGPFYRKRISHVDATVPRVGSFDPNTKEARVLMLLHELGHLVKGPDGNWLLPNDGKDDALSLDNSLKIQEVCGEELKSLSKTKSLDFAATKRPDQPVAQRTSPEFSNQ